MFVMFPNPYNVRRRVLILFGCHRIGQFALEHWLRSADIAVTCAQLAPQLEQERRDDIALQIIVDRVRDVHHEQGEWAAPCEARAVPNHAQGGQPFWITRLSDHSCDDPFQVNLQCANGAGMFDLSLLYIIDKARQKGLANRVRGLINGADLYWEDEQCDIGFHVTLFEFATHHDPDELLAVALDRAANTVLAGLRRAKIPTETKARIRQLELLPRALVSYVDFLDEEGQPSDWLNAVRSWCEGCAMPMITRERNAAKPLFNALRAPFPQHVTLCRFNREINVAEREAFKLAVRQMRYREFCQIPLKSVALTIARKTPYCEVLPVGTIELQSL